MDEQYVLIFDDFEKFLDEIEDFETIHLIYDDTLNKFQIDQLEQMLGKKRVVKSYFPNCMAQVCIADKIEYLGEGLVLGVGGVHLSSLAKYYAASFDLSFAMIPVKEVAEFSFSKYAFLQDKYYCFFEATSPQCVFVCSKFFLGSDIFLMQKVLSYKNIVLFEKEFEKDILKQTSVKLESLVKCINICDGNLKSIIKIFGICANLIQENNIYDFLGSEYVVLSLLCCGGKNFSNNLVATNNLLFKFFECFLKFDIASVEPDINLHIHFLKEEYKINLLEISETVLVKTTLQDQKEIKYRLKSYLPYLNDLFEKCSLKFVRSKCDMSNDELSKCLALSPSLFDRKNILRLARDFGYFDALLKN